MVTGKAKNKRGRWLRITLIVLAVLIIIRAVLPSILLHYANKTLANMDGYYGHIRDIDLAIYRGAYQVNDAYLNKVDSVTNKQTDFISAKMVDLSVEWSSLFKGRIVGELEFHQPKVVFTKDKAEIGDVAKDTNDFRKLLKDFMPLKVNRFEVFNGSIHYVDKTANPKVDVALANTHVLAQNLSNVVAEGDVLPSTVTASANAYEGTMKMNMKLNALAEQPTFDMNTTITNTNLVLLNDFLNAYGNFDVNKGRFGLYTEFAAKDGKFAGYVKPIIKDLDVLGPEDKKETFFRRLWEGVVGTVGKVFENPRKEQLATKVPIEGNFKNPDINTWEAVWEVIRNAFIQALMPAIDQQVDISSVDEGVSDDDRNLIQRIFTKKDIDNGDESKKESRREKREERKARKK